MLASPFSLSYDMSMVTAAAWLLLQDIARTGARPGERAIVALTWTLPLVIYLLNEAHIPIGPLVLISAFVLVMMRLGGRQSGVPPATADGQGMK